uniref:Cyanocobalamin reductase / alkylcobalamin dealkylase n=1 Tax=Leptobrachium leishanense TaxID=445787 RepID=A0A8C5Q235_9ANUR
MSPDPPEATDIPSASTPATSFEPPAGQSQSEVAQLSVTTRSPELHTKWTATITTNAFLRSTASPTILATQSTAPNKTSPSEVQEQPSVLDVGEKDLPKFYSRGNSNSLFVMIISIFTIMVVLVIVVVVFHRYRQKNNRTEFRRLQDLPMIGWYNAVLDPPFHLPYPEDALAFVVLSVPSMFERTFIPFLREHKLQELRDPIDQCVAHQISLAQQSFPSDRIDVIYDYELHPNRRPKALMQTAAHVSGATYYYQRSDVLQDPWGDKKMFGVCIHPRFGGWFAIRAVLVFSDVRAPSLEQLLPIDCIPSREDRIQLLEDFNLRWRDGKYRDVLPPEERYSAEQILYFATPPAERFKLLEEWGVLHQPPLG